MEIRDENDVDPDEQIIIGAVKSNNDIVDIDSTENLRTVIVSTELNKEDFIRYQINLDWTLDQLTSFICT